MDEVTPQSEKKYVDLRCLGKGKRILCFLADFFIVFILSLMMFHLAVYPLGRVIADYDGQMTSLRQAQQKRDKILYDSGLLFPETDGATCVDQFDASLAFTATNYIHCFVDGAWNQKYEVFDAYFAKIRTDKPALITFYKALDEGQGFFDFGAEKVTLKAAYVSEFAPAFNPQDEMSEQGKKDYSRFENKIFAQGYNRMLSDIMEKDLVRGGVSYVAEQNKITSALNNSKTLIVISAVASFLLVWFICHIIVPLLNKKHRTIGMMAMRIERIHSSDFDVYSIPMTYLASLYALASEMACVIFIPWGVTNFNELFALPMLFVLSIISLVYILASIAMVLLDAYNRSIGEFLSRGFYISNDDFDTLVRERGYKR